VAPSDKPLFRVLSEEEFNRLTPEQKLAYLSAAFSAAIKSGDPSLNRRTPGSTPAARKPPALKPKNR